VSLIATCSQFSAANECIRLEYVEGAVLTASEVATVRAFSQFDSEMFQVGFGGVIALFAAGFIIGIIINIIRKAK